MASSGERSLLSRFDSWALRFFFNIQQHLGAEGYIQRAGMHLSTAALQIDIGKSQESIEISILGQPRV